MITEPNEDLLDLGEFLIYLQQELVLEIPLSADLRLVYDVEMDSIELFELLCIVEDLDVELPVEAIEPGTSFASLHEQYVNAHLQRQHQGDALP